MALMEVGLDDKYRLDAKRIFLSGTQALVRLPMLQRERDRAAGLNTAGFISGYRGSPLGMYDHALWRAKTFLKQHDIEFAPGLNEDLAATAVWGSQQVGMFPGAKVDGVFGIWYGKGPGVDRSMDALKHANSAGTSPNGGVIALAGDDHGCQSSTLAHQSEQVFAAALMPVVNPATLQDYLDLGILGFALSRYSSCWVGFKAISETVESSASIVSDPDRIKIIMPDDFEMPPGGLSIRWPDAPLEQERRLHGPKMQAVAAFTRANRFDRIVLDSKPARLGIMATGKAYLDLRQALADLGISDAEAQALGLRIYKVALTWPLEESGARAFAEGLQDVLVVEEKRGFIEDQLLRILYNVDASKRPSVVGKRDESGAPLLPSEGELTPTMVAAAVVARLRKLGHRSPALEQRLAKLEAFDRPAEGIGAAKLQRTPYFCSGCPHNTSTKIPEGSRAMAGIGCHGMALSVPNRRTQTISHMGAEGVTWIGQAPFTSEPHVFQNFGDGTYTHSGLLAIRAAAAAGVNITYKILYNDAVAMTGGQPAEGGLTVSQIAHQVSAEGAKRLVIVSDDPEKYPSNYFPSGATVHHRRELDAVQRELREVKGLTVLIYDQTCAAEKRRRRKRGLYPDPPKRVFINERVCEGCGDCSAVSNCVSVQPLETEFGRKRRIDQSNCNKDFSCIEGFCPSFVTVHGGKLRKADRTAADPSALFADLPLPATPALDGAYNILVTGIGGTGVITIGALLGMAAHVEGKACSTLDFTGLSQKNGAVMSHVRIAPRGGRSRHRPHRARRRQPHPRLRHRGRHQHSGAEPGRARRDARDRQRRPAADRELRHQSRHRFRGGHDAGVAQRGRQRLRSRHSRRDRACHGADGRQHRHQRLHARLCVPARRDPAVAGGDHEGDRPQWRGDRDEQAGVLLGPARRARSAARRQRCALQEFGRGAGQADARREHRVPRQVPDGLSERGLFEALPRRGRARPRRRSQGRARFA